MEKQSPQPLMCRIYKPTAVWKQVAERKNIGSKAAGFIESSCIKTNILQTLFVLLHSYHHD